MIFKGMFTVAAAHHGMPLVTAEVTFRAVYGGSSLLEPSRTLVYHVVK